MKYVVFNVQLRYSKFVIFQTNSQSLGQNSNKQEATISLCDERTSIEIRKYDSVVNERESKKKHGALGYWCGRVAIVLFPIGASSTMLPDTVSLEVWSVAGCAVTSSCGPYPLFLSETRQIPESFPRFYDDQDDVERYSLPMVRDSRRRD